VWTAPHWVAVVNIDHLADAIQSIYSVFAELPKDFKGNEMILKIQKERRKKYLKAFKKIAPL
jgi:hypothetical protein